MPRLQRKSFATPDQVREFPSGRIEIVRLDEIAVGRFVLQPGWRWSKDVAPVAATRSCQLRHVGYTISGSIEVHMDDGTVLVIGPGDAYEIPPGHDVLVLGDEPFDSVEFNSAHAFGLSPEEMGERILATILFSDIVDSTVMAREARRPRVDGAAPRAQRADPRRDRSLPRARDRIGGRRLPGALRRRREGGARRGADGSVDGGSRRSRASGPAHRRGGDQSAARRAASAVHAAARVASLAGPGEVLVSGTTRDLLDGSGLSLDPRGEHELKGLRGARPIFALRR